MLLRYLNRQATDCLQGRVAVYIGASTPLLLFRAALAALDAERHSPRANITTFGDSLWWATMTLSQIRAPSANATIAPPANRARSRFHQAVDTIQAGVSPP